VHSDFNVLQLLRRKNQLDMPCQKHVSTDYESWHFRIFFITGT